MSTELSELYSVLSSLGDSLRRDFNSVPPLPLGVTRDFSIVLDNCMKDLVHLQTIVQKFIDYENGGAFAAAWKNWRLLFADKDLTKSLDSLVAY